MKKNTLLKKILPVIVAVIGFAVAVIPDVLQGWRTEREARSGAANPQSLSVPAAQRDNEALYALIAAKHSGEMVLGEGIVQKVLKDDNEGSRHQRFILDIGEGKTLLVAHNVDLAPRLPDLQVGDRVQFYGQYESNHRGGVLHWTHRDPAKRHTAGWLHYKGKRYE